MLNVRTTARALGLGAALSAVFAAAPAPGFATEAEDNKCTDAAWANYNECLMSSGNLEWAKKECDAEFELEYATCYKALFVAVYSLFSKAS